MALTTTYLAKSASIAGTSYSGLISFRVAKRGNRADLRSDGDLYQRKAPIVSIEETLEIELRDASAAPVMGQSGSTVLTGIKNTGGVTLSGTLVATCAASVVDAVECTIDMDGRPVVRVTVSVQSSDGVSSGVVWSST
jgi:hypothetical protein